MESFQQLAGAFAGNALLCALALLVSLTVVIFVHEFGHYLAARFFGVRVEKFSIGLGKEVWGRTDRNGTRWCISRWPIGGFIKIHGDVNPDRPEVWDPVKKRRRLLSKAELKGAFCTKPVWQRAIIVAAGPAVNILLAVVLLYALFVVKGQVSTLPVVNAIAQGTAAHEAGFQLGDRVVAFEGEPVVRLEDVWEKTLHNAGEVYHFTVLRDGKEVTIEAASRAIAYKDRKGIKRAHGRLGATYIGAVKLKDIVSVNGKDINDDLELARKLLRASMGKEIKLGVRSFEGPPDVFLIRGLEEFNAPLGDPAHEDHDLFFSKLSAEKFYVRHDPVDAAIYTGRQIAKFFDEAYKIMEAVLTGGSKGERVLGGVATMGDAAGKAAESGVYSFIVFIVVLSVQIAFINLLPIPLLDGGYLVFLALEAISGRPLPERVQDYAFSLGLAFLIGIMVLANLSDILQFTR